MTAHSPRREPEGNKLFSDIRPFLPPPRSAYPRSRKPPAARDQRFS
jgi:hypothetical protein